jgi:hypothetical protein
MNLAPIEVEHAHDDGAVFRPSVGERSAARGVNSPQAPKRPKRTTLRHTQCTFDGSNTVRRRAIPEEPLDMVPRAEQLRFRGYARSYLGVSDKDRVSNFRPAAGAEPDRFERTSPAAGAQQAGAEDPLAKLERLVESWKLASATPPAPARAVAPPARTSQATPQPLKPTPLGPPIDEGRDDRAEPGAIKAEASQLVGAEDDQPQELSQPELSSPRRFVGWKLAASALAVACSAMIGAVFVLKGGVSGLPKESPFIAAADGPTKAPPPSDGPATAASDAGAPLMKKNAPSAQVDDAGSGRQPVNPIPPPSIGGAPASASAPAAVGAIEPAGEVSSVKPLAEWAGAPTVAAPAPAPARQLSEPDTVSAIPPAANGTATAAPFPSAAGKPATEVTSDAAGPVQPSTLRRDQPTNHPSKSSARAGRTKTHETSPSTAAETPSPPHALRTPAQRKEAIGAPKTAQAAAEPPAAPAEQAAPDQRPVNPILSAFPLLGAFRDSFK